MRYVIALAAMVSVASINAAEEGKHLFILSGQSNMANLAPNVSFTPAVEAAFGKDNVIVVKDARGSSAIRKWYKKWKPAKGDAPKDNGDLYDRLMLKINAAIGSNKIQTVTFVWMQGEHDAHEKNDNVYKESLLGLVKQLSDDMKRDDVNYVIGRLSRFRTDENWEGVRKAQVEAAEASSRGAWVDTDDVDINGIHYTAEGYKDLGKRFAEKAIALIKKEYAPQPVAHVRSEGARLQIDCEPAPAPRRVENFNRDWTFVKGAQPGAESVGFDDSSWKSVRLPHDWAISGPYDPQGEYRTGKLPWRGEGWYRKSFSLPASDAGKRVYLDFDGVMAMPTVYINGHKVGGWDYGYVAFRVDASEFIKPGQPNVVAVHVDTRTHFSRWYPGAGIYRNVRLVVNEPVHVAQWGLFITTPIVTATSASVRVETTLNNHTGAAVQPEVETVLNDPEGREVAKQRTRIAVPAGGSATGPITLFVAEPRLWDVATPQLYTAVTRVFVGDQLMDSTETPFGIRTFQFTANDGFHLNGRRVQLQGVNLHSDLGPLGMAFNTRAVERQLRIMQDMGVNAVRTAHNPPASGFLELCDRMGIVVWNEVFDKWDATATLPEGVSIPEHGRKQITNFVLRDRNHPCVVVWSVGNEIKDLETLQYPDAPGLLKTMVGFVKELDITRPVGLGHCRPESAKSQLQAALDVTGWNYAATYALTHELWPKLPIIYSESASALSTRGYYDDFPMPRKKDVYPATARISSYDHTSTWCSDPADVEFALMEKDRFVAGEFVWTGFDYIGEPHPFLAEGRGAFRPRKLTLAEESRSSSFGIVDLVGIPKDRYYLYRSYWAPEKKTIHILPHWNWPERVGKNTPVYVYTSGDSAELFLNGKSLGRRTKNPKAEVVRDRYALRWLDLPYQPGELKVVAYRDGRELGTAFMRTAGEPAKLRLTQDRTSLKADGDDLSYVLVEAVDKDGNLCPLAMNDVTFELAGPALIGGVGNGDHHFPAEFVTNRVALFYGKAMLIVRAVDGHGGEISVTAKSEGLRDATAIMQCGNN